MHNTSFELDKARAILTTYRQVHDNSPPVNRINRSKLQQKNKELENELIQLKEKYTILQKELLNRNKRLESLHQELCDKTSYMSRLQEDFENAIYQLGQRKEA